MEVLKQSMAEEDARLKYERVADEIRKLVEKSEDGARLPSERKLATMFGVSFLTVRKGLQPLVDEGCIERRAGSGTFVTALKPVSVPRPVVSERSTRLGLFVFRDSDAYAHRILHAIDEAAAEEGVSLRHAWINEPGEHAVQRAREFKAEGVKALVFPWIPSAFCSGEGARQLGQFINVCRLPVTLGALIPGLEANCFVSPSRYGSNMTDWTLIICAYLRLLKNERIALLGPDDIENVLLQKKVAAYAHYVCREGLECMVALLPDSPGAIEAQADKWMQYRGKLAIITYDDAIASRYMEAMAKRGQFAPKDFRIIGFNGTEESAKTNPPLTTVRSSYESSAKNLLRSAVAMAQGGVYRDNIGHPPITLMIRQTCGGLGRIEQVKSEMQKICGQPINWQIEGGF